MIKAAKKSRRDVLWVNEVRVERGIIGSKRTLERFMSEIIIF